MITILLTKIIALLTSISQKTFVNWHIYSTEERKIGEWIDGSTIYEKVIDVSESDYKFSTNWIDMGNLVPDGNVAVDCRILDEQGQVHPAGCSVSGGTLNIYIPYSTISNFNYRPIYKVIVQYTKSSSEEVTP